MFRLKGVGGWFRGLSPGGATAIALGMVLCVGIGDELTGTASFTLLYLGPVAFGTWFVGLRAGLLVSVVSAGVSLTTDLRLAHASSPAVAAWNLLVQLGVFLARALLLDALRSRLIFEQQAANVLRGADLLRQRLETYGGLDAAYHDEQRDPRPRAHR